jgi:fatty acid-binding protein DegV
MRIALCTDSSSLLSASAAASLGVDVVPVEVTLDGDPFDELTSSLEWFYQRLRAGAEVTSSEPRAAAFAETYERASARGAESVVSIHADARVSAAAGSAERAKHDASLPVTVVDTRTVGYGVAVCVRAAAATAAAGRSAADTALSAVRCGEALQNVVVARESRWGRIPTVGGWTLARFADGTTSPFWECGSIGEAVERTVSLVRHGAVPLGAAVGHAGRELEPAADELAHALGASERIRSMERYRIGASVVVHTGADIFGACWWPLR